VISDPTAGFNQTPLGSVKITNGSFSGYVDGVTSGYVVIETSDNNYYINSTLSPVTLGTSMNFNLSTMTLVTDN
jgi:hypothetical protein